MAGIRVVTDSACDLPQALADEHGIEIVPLTIRFGDEELVDRRDLSAKEFWARSAESPVLPEGRFLARAKIARWNDWPCRSWP